MVSLKIFRKFLCRACIRPTKCGLVTWDWASIWPNKCGLLKPSNPPPPTVRTQKSEQTLSCNHVPQEIPMTTLCSTVPKLPFLTSSSSRPSTSPIPSNAWALSSPPCNIFNKFASLSLALALLSSAPSLASPLTSPNPTTPFSLSKNLELGLEDG